MGKSDTSQLTAPAERLLWPGRASPSAPQLLAYSPGKEQAAGVWATTTGGETLHVAPWPRHHQQRVRENLWCARVEPACDSV